jgi:hypothetical protein
MTGAAILGLAGTALTPREAAFFRQADPWGFILFARNIDTPAQVAALTAALRTAVGRDAPVFIDQEGGRVQRLRSPHWREWDPPLDFAVWPTGWLAAEALIVDVDGFEGPLDLLLTLSRTQKVDLRRISVLQLAEQYLGFVEQARALRIELAADYLVMAAWLAYLKSRLLLPPDPTDDGPSAEDLAAHLAFQLERLQAMREAAARLMARDQLGRDFFARGLPERM